MIFILSKILGHFGRNRSFNVMHNRIIQLTIWYICHIILGGKGDTIRIVEKFAAEFYTKTDGEKPAKEFILSLDNKMRAKLLGIIDVLEEKGPLLREPYSKSLGDGIFEIRGQLGRDISRVLFFFYYNKRIILTNGFIK